MNKNPILSCCLTYGFETSDSFSIAKLLEQTLKVQLDVSNRPDMGGEVYQFQSWTANVGELESVLLYPNYVDGFGWKEQAFKNFPFVTEIFWKTTNLLELGRLAAAIEVYSNLQSHLIRYEVIGEMFGDRVIHQLRREFHLNEEREPRWDNNFDDIEAKNEKDDLDNDEKLDEDLEAREVN